MASATAAGPAIQDRLGLADHRERAAGDAPQGEPGHHDGEDRDADTHADRGGERGDRIGRFQPQLDRESEELPCPTEQPEAERCTGDRSEPTLDGRQEPNLARRSPGQAQGGQTSFSDARRHPRRGPHEHEDGQQDPHRSEDHRLDDFDGDVLIRVLREPELGYVGPLNLLDLPGADPQVGG